MNQLTSPTSVAPLQRLTDEVVGLRDDMQALTAIVHRLDNSHTRLLGDIRATDS
jgi:hypothetical protein